jgi:ribosomal protein S18 acetylase RimI-like enzyme
MSPEELRVRGATPEDYPAFVRFQEILGITWPALPRDRWIAQLLPDTRYLVDAADRIVGYALCKAYGPRGDVRQIAVEPAWQGRGVGRRLMALCAEHLRAAGCREWQLEVMADNAAALRLYEGVGLRRVRQGRSQRLAVDRLRPALDGEASEVWPVTPERDPTLEARFDLLPGMLAQRRLVWPQARAWGAGAQDRPDGLALHRPELEPGVDLVWPCRAAHLPAARALLGAVLAGSRASTLETFTQDDFFGDWLAGLGATLQATMADMRGAL